jgi:hypothetical protein
MMGLGVIALAWTPVMIQPAGIDNGAVVVSTETVCYARILLLFSASAMTDAGSKSFECAFVSTPETYDDPENGNCILLHTLLQLLQLLY